MHLMSIFCLAADTVSSGSWFIVLNVLIFSRSYNRKWLQIKKRQEAEDILQKV